MNPNNPFFPENPLEDFKPEKPDFEPEIDPDYDENLEEPCDCCSRELGAHTTYDLAKCCLTILRGEKPIV